MTPDDRADQKNKLKQIGDGKVGMELMYLVSSRYKVLYVVSNEERRVIDCFRAISLAEGYNLYQWDFTRGMLESHSMLQVSSGDNEINELPAAALSWIIDKAKEDYELMRLKKARGCKGHIFMLLDFHNFLRGCEPELERHIKHFSSIPSACCMVIVAPKFECPTSLEKEVTLIDFPYPSDFECRESLSMIKKDITAQFPKARKFAQEREEDLLKAVRGLTLTEAENAYAKTLVKHKNFDVPTILEEKKQIIRKSGILEYRESRFRFDDIGGLNTLKEWLNLRKMAFMEEARKYGLSAPKGVLLVGIPGTGKSMICDALAHCYEMPLLRLDMGAIFSSHVGESEHNMREVIKSAEAIAPVILWIDEVEKGIGGVQSSNQTDGGVTNRIFGTLLTWMQEKESPVFVVCTANNVLSMPPEFMRAGRFDEIFFLDLPDKEQRAEVVSALLLRKNRNPDEFDLDGIADVCDKYSPAELEKAINNALFIAYSDKAREVRTDDIISEIGKFQPLYNTRRDEIEAMREWALGEDGSGGRAVLANSPTEKSFDYSNADIGRGITFSEDLEV